MRRYIGFGCLSALALALIVHSGGRADKPEDDEIRVAAFGTQKQTCDSFRADFSEASAQRSQLHAGNVDSSELKMLRDRRYEGDKENLTRYGCHS